jgi:hypothetical protein
MADFAKAREESTPKPPDYEAAAAYNRAFIPDNVSSLPPAYVEKDSSQYPPGFPSVPPSYVPGTAPPAGAYVAPPPPPGFYPIAGQQPVGYGMTTGNPQAYVFVQPTPLVDPPNDYMGYAMFVTICCCWIVGLFAIARASECRTAIRLGNRQEAVMKSRQAKKNSHIALALGIVSAAVAATIFGIYYGFMASRYR